MMMATTDNTAPGIRRVNAKSDFDFILRMACGCKKEGEEQVDIGWPEFDWKAKFWTWSPANAYVVGCTGGVCTNCFNDNGRIHVVFNNHRLSSGDLHCELSADIPASIYPDGKRREVLPQHTGIELVEGAGDCYIGETEIELTLPVVYMTAYDLAVRNGYQGTLNEYIAYVNRFPQVVETSDTVMRLLSDFDHGKALVADALTRQGSETLPSEPLASMADKVLGLRLAVEGQPGIVDQSFGGRLPYTDLLNLLRNNQRAEWPYCYAVRHALNSVTLIGADAYLCSDGFFSEEGGEHEFSDFDDRWVIYYFKNADYMVSAPKECIEIVALNGRPQFSIAEVNCTSVRSYTQELYEITSQSNLKATFSELVLSGVTRMDVAIAYNSSNLRMVALPDLRSIGNVSFVSNCINYKNVYFPKYSEHKTGILLNVQNATSAALPILTTVSGGTMINSCSGLTELTLPALATVSGGTVISSCAALTELSLPSLTTVSGGYVVQQCSGLTELTLPKLRISSGGEIAKDCLKMQVLNLPELEEIGRLNSEYYFISNGENLPEQDLHVYMPKLRILKAYLYGCNDKIAQSMVYVHLGAIIDGDFNFRYASRANGSKTVVTVKQGFRSDLAINKCTGMTAEQLRDIIRNLGDNTDYMTLNIIFGAENLAKLTDEDIALATAKNYTLS